MKTAVLHGRPDQSWNTYSARTRLCDNRLRSLPGKRQNRAVTLQIGQTFRHGDDHLRRSKNDRLAKTAASYMNLTFLRRRLVCLASARISCVCDLIRRLDSQEKIIVFGERISQADELYHLLQDAFPEKAGRCHSRMGSQANKNVLERFRTGSIRILIACKSIDEGFDVPDASVGIILSGTSTKHQHIQRLSRIIRRKKPDVRAALYYLHIANTVEDSCYLPEEGAGRLFTLSYDAQTAQFDNPDYHGGQPSYCTRWWKTAQTQPDCRRRYAACNLAASDRTGCCRERSLTNIFKMQDASARKTIVCV